MHLKHFSILAMLLVASSLVGCSSGRPGDAAISKEFEVSRVIRVLDGGVTTLLDTFYIPAGEEWVYSEPVEIRAYGPIVVDGVLRGESPDHAEREAPSLHLSSLSGVIIRGHLQAAPGATGEGVGASGGKGGDVSIHAPVLVLNEQLRAGIGGKGGPAGTGGTGGNLKVFSNAAVGPYWPDEQKRMTAGSSNLHGGTGGPGGGSHPDHTSSGSGGTGGSAQSGFYRELPWMLEYRYRYLLKDREIEAAKESDEIR
jgi:hypothetical protein